MMKILAIDDNQDNLISLKALIKDAFPEAQLFTALSGEKGVELAMSEVPDVILLDIVMPNMDGFEVCRKLKADPILRDVPVVFLTALKGDKESRIRALECGGEAFLAKPIDETELTAQIRAMVKIKQANLEKRDENERLAALVQERTHQLQQELEERKKSEERFKHVFESANAGKSITLPAGEINVNQAFCDMLGYTKEELKNKRWQDITPVEDIDFTQKFVNSLLKGESNSARFNKRYLHKNGSLLWADVSVAILRDQHGNPLHFITTIIDISERKKAEEALRLSEERAMALLNGFPESAFLMDPNGIVIAANTTVAERLNSNLDNLIGSNIFKQVNQEVADRRHNFADLVLETKLPIQFEDERFGKIIDNRIHPIFDQQGNVIQFAIIGIDITERKKAELRIRESEMRSRSTFDQSPIGSVIVGLDKRFIKCNAAFCRFLGYTEDEMIGRTISEITYPDDKELGILDMKLMVEGKKESSTLQKRYLRKDGTTVWGEVSISLVRNADNKPMYFLPVIQDITERKQAEKHLNESKERYQTILQTAMDGYWIVDIRGRLIEVNETYCRMSGYSEQELLSMRISDLEANELPDHVAAHIQSIMTKGEDRFETRHRRKDGTIFNVEISVQYQFIDNGLLVVFIKDITERKEAEEALRESEERYRTVVSNTPVVTFVTDEKGIFTLSEGKGLIKLGLQPGQVVGLSVYDVYRDYPSIITAMNNAFAGKSQREEILVQGIVFDVYFSPVFDKNGKVVKVIGVSSDITERKQAEEALSESNEFSRLLLQTIPFGMDIVDENGNIMFQSENLRKIFGDEAIGRKCWELYCDSNVQCSDCPILNGIETGQTETYQSTGVFGGKVFEINHTGMMFKGKKAMLEIFQDVTERKSIDDLLNFVARRGWIETNHEFLPALAEYLGQLLKVDYIIIDKLTTDHAIAETVGLYANGEVVPNLSYTLAGTPCENVIGKDMCHICQNVQQLFPSDLMLVEMKAESYLGIPLWDSSGNPIGLIAALDSKPLVNVEQAISLIKLVATAAGAELERQREEKALRESEAQYRLLAEHMTDTVWMMDMNLTITYISPSIEKLRGFTFEEIQQLPLEKQLTPESYQIAATAFSEEMNNILSDPTYFTSRIIELEFYRKDGSTYWSDNTLTLIRDKMGNPVSFLGEGRDITERKKAEEALRKSEEKYRTIFENVQDVFYQTDLEGNMLEISPSIKYYTEFSREEILGTPVTNLYYNPNDRLTIINELMKKGEVRDFQLKIKSNNDQIKYASINARLIFGSDGKPHHIDGAIRDVTERKLAEKQIQQLSRAIEQSTVSVVITNKEGDIEYTNPKVSALTGYGSDELKGKNPRILKSGEQSVEFYKVLWDTILSGNNWHGEFHNKKKNGELYWESATISPIMNENGDITNFIAIKEDITESKKIIRELIDAKEKAEESDRLKSAFLANMSHEIRTPMNSIMGFASLLPEEDSKELISNYANIIVQNSEQLVHVIDDIVLYSRLQTKLLSYIPIKFDALNLLFDVKQSFNLPEFHLGVELKIETESEEPVLIQSDYEKLRQVFTNLISNAFKYTSHGIITIGLTKQNNKLIFFVKDTGLGIPPDELEKVFERFYRGSNVNKGMIGGTGLGLSIVKELLELLGGHIWVESDPDGDRGGNGSSFYFTLNEINTLDN